MSLVELTQVSKVYRSLQGSDYVAVRDFSLEIQTGEFFCLLGTSGCGKTTILNMVAGFEPVSSGDIRISGQPIRGPPPIVASSSRATIRSMAGSPRWATSNSACACAARRPQSAGGRHTTISSWSASGARITNILPNCPAA